MKFNKWTMALAAAGVVSLGSVAQAEEAGNHVLTALSKTTISGYVDTSASWQVGSKTKYAGLSSVRAGHQGSGKMDGFNLDVVSLALENPMDESDWAAGYRVDLLFGPDAVAYNAPLNSDGTSDVGIRQAYVETRAPIGNGLDLKMGVFDTIIGYEVFANGSNPNYSRSMAWSLEPTQHTGALASYQLNDIVSVSAGIANTSRAVINDRSTAAGGPTASPGHLSYLGSITVVAPEDAGFLAGGALYAGVVDGLAGNSSTTPDTTNWYLGATLPTPVDGLAVGVAFDFIQNTPFIAGADDVWLLAGYASYQATDKATLHARVEYADVEFLGGGDMSLLGVTGTLDYSLWDNVLTRAEVRWDHDLDDTGLFGANSDGVVTLTLNAIYSF